MAAYTRCMSARPLNAKVELAPTVIDADWTISTPTQSRPRTASVRTWVERREKIEPSMNRLSDGEGDSLEPSRNRSPAVILSAAKDLAPVERVHARSAPGSSLRSG